MWELDHKEGWTLKNWCFWTVVLEKTLESALDYKEIKPVNPKGNQSWIFIGRTDAEASVLWSSVAKSQFIRKDPDAGKDWRQEEKGTTENEMVGWHHQLNGHEFAQSPGDVMDREAWCAAVRGVTIRYDWAIEQQQQREKTGVPRGRRPSASRLPLDSRFNSNSCQASSMATFSADFRRSCFQNHMRQFLKSISLCPAPLMPHVQTHILFGDS